MIFLLSIGQAVVVFIFFIAIIRQILYWSWLWQLKEYRIDRMRAHFQDIGVKSAFSAMIGYSSLRQTKIPKFTLKAILISVISFLFSFGVLLLLVIPTETGSPYLYGDPVSVGILNYFIIGYLIMPIFIFLTVLFLNILSAIFKKRIIAKAMAKVAKFPNLKVIGITGSYGKSTTKEILAEILSKKYKVLKTPANNNTAIGIAQLILNKLDESYEIFVVEMGAYKIGEIKEICDMVRPKIGIITAVNEQHLALFGSIENTIKAKFELVDSLPKGGLAILNGDDKQTTKYKFQITNKPQSINYKLQTEVKIISFGFGENNDLRGYDIIDEGNKTKFKVKYKGGELGEFMLKIPGEFNVYNALAAVITAKEVGMSMNEIFQIIQKNDWPDFSLKILAGPNNSILIDDTYNSNPDGVFAVLSHIKNQRGRKIVVITSLIELGSRSHRIHQKIGKEISSAASQVFFLDNYYITDIKKGVAENEQSNIEIKNEKNIKKISEYLKNELKPSDTVLFINRGARKVLEKLKK